MVPPLRIDQVTWDFKDLSADYILDTNNQINQGGTSTIYPVMHKDYPIPLVAKVIDNIDSSILLFSEASVLSRLDHPNVIQLYDYGTLRINDRKHDTLIFPAYQADLRVFMFHTADDLKRFFIKLYECIEYIHSKNVIHQDIQGPNILISDMSNPELILMDFALSRIVSNQSILESGIQMDFRKLTFLFRAKLLQLNIEKYFFIVHQIDSLFINNPEINWKETIWTFINLIQSTSEP